MTQNTIRRTIEGALSDFDSIPSYWQQAVDKAVTALEVREADLATDIAELADNRYALPIGEALSELRDLGMNVEMPKPERTPEELAELNAELDRRVADLTAELDRRVAEWKTELGI